MIEFPVVGKWNKRLLKQLVIGGQFTGVAVTTDDVQQQIGEQQDKDPAQVTAVWVGHYHHVKTVVNGNSVDHGNEQHVQDLEQACSKTTHTDTLWNP